MYIHAFALKWKVETTEEQKRRVAREIVALQGKFPGLLATHVGNNDSPRGRGHGFGGVMLFADRAAFEGYFAHPVHDELMGWVGPLLVDTTELDFEAVSSRAEFEG